MNIHIGKSIFRSDTGTLRVIWACLLRQISELQDKVTAAETESAELKNKVDDMEYESSKAAEKLDRLERLLAEKTQKLQYYTDTGATVTIEGGKAVTGLTRARVSGWTGGCEWVYEYVCDLMHVECVCVCVCVAWLVCVSV